MGNPLNTNRDGARCLQLFIFNEESLVCAFHQSAQNASLPFVHTARRSYRLSGPARSQEALGGELSGLSPDAEFAQTLSLRGS